MARAKSKRFILVEVYSKRKRKDTDKETYGISFTKHDTERRAIEAMHEKCNELIDESEMDAAVRRTKGLKAIPPKYRFEDLEPDDGITIRMKKRHQAIIGGRWPQESFEFYIYPIDEFDGYTPKDSSKKLTHDDELYFAILDLMTEMGYRIVNIDEED